MQRAGFQITMPPWRTLLLFAFILLQVLISCFRARKTGKPFPSFVLPDVLVAAAVAILFARGFFEDLPVWIDAPVAILCLLIILIAVGIWLVRLKGFLKEAWSMEHKRDK